MNYEIVTFDCYGTLVDWEAGISEAFRTALSPALFDRKRILDAHAEIEPVVEEESFRSYREVLQETAWRMAQRFDWPLTQQACAFLPRSLPSWPAFPDTLPALRRLRQAGIAVAILSNVDDDLLAGTLVQLPVDFEFIVTAQQVRSYKPAEPHFREAAKRIGERRWLHAAGSWFHDIEPCLQCGTPAAWVNRHAAPQPGGGEPNWNLRDMTQLADRLLAHE